MSEQTNISFEAALMIALRADSLEFCLHRNGR